jgi:hypothetical protein
LSPTTVAPERPRRSSSQEKLTYLTALECIRLVYGIAQLRAPAMVARAVGGRADDDSLRVRRVLGARHVVQALLLLGAPRGYHVIGAAVDATHAATAFAWAGLDRTRRGDAAINGATSLVFAVAEAAR